MSLEKYTSKLEEYFFNYLAEKIGDKELEKGVSNTLNRMEIKGVRKSYEIKIVNRNNKEPFFGMRVFPQEGLDTISKNLVYDRMSLKEITGKWNELKAFYIEIDYNVFNRYEINLNPKELTALLLHEIAHTVYSDEVINRLYISYKDAYTKLKYSEQESLKVLYILYSTALLTSCKVKKRKIDKRVMQEEMDCDKVLGIKGYAECMVSALNKIIAAYGNSDISCTSAEEVDRLINWCNLNAKDLIKRKDNLKDDLAYMSIRSSSNFIKAWYVKVLHTLGVSLQERYTGAATECVVECFESADKFTSSYTTTYTGNQIGFYVNSVNNALNKSVYESFKGKPKKPMLPSEYDIDIIQVEVDRITNHSDRKYVLDLIYTKIEDINTYLEFIDDDPQLIRRYEPRAKKMLDNLYKYRAQVLSKNNFDKNYKVFVKAPEGYEG